MRRCRVCSNADISSESTSCSCSPSGSDAMHGLQVDIIASQGILELFILVAALRLHRKGYQAVNFELLWAEYAKTRGMQHADIYSKPAAARAFQRLLDASLLAFTGPGWGSFYVSALFLRSTAITCRRRYIKARSTSACCSATACACFPLNAASSCVGDGQCMHAIAGVSHGLCIKVESGWRCFTQV